MIFMIDSSIYDKNIFMKKQGIFEYVNLKKQEFKSKEGKPYIKYIVVSDVKGETQKVKDKLKTLGFHPYKPDKYSWEGFHWFIYGNELTNEILNGLKEINDELKTEGNQSEDINKFIGDLENLKSEVDESSLPPVVKKDLDALIDQFVDDIINATDEKAADILIQKYIEFQQKFRNYSFSNTMLIFLQDRNATKVAGKKKWEKDFNRKVINPKKAIWIWCANQIYVNPASGKEQQYSLDQQKKDNEYLMGVKSGTIPVDQKTIDDINKRKKIIKTKFEPCVVYDVANTEGDPLPQEPNWKGTYDDRADAIALSNIAIKTLGAMGIDVTNNPAFHGEGGYSAGGTINISAGASGSGSVSTLFHEWAHELLHHEGGLFYDEFMEELGKKGQLSKKQITAIQEIQVETISAVLCKYYGLPAEHHPTYMALWQIQGNLKSKELIKENISTIRKVSNFIISQIDKNRDEFDKVRAQMQTQNQTV